VATKLSVRLADVATRLVGVTPKTTKGASFERYWVTEG
jgi:hypothetical protein